MSKNLVWYLRFYGKLRMGRLINGLCNVYTLYWFTHNMLQLRFLFIFTSSVGDNAWDRLVSLACSDSEYRPIRSRAASQLNRKFARNSSPIAAIWSGRSRNIRARRLWCRRWTSLNLLAIAILTLRQSFATALIGNTEFIATLHLMIASRHVSKMESVPKAGFRDESLATGVSKTAQETGINFEHYMSQNVPLKIILMPLVVSTITNYISSKFRSSSFLQF